MGSSSGPVAALESFLRPFLHGMGASRDRSPIEGVGAGPTIGK